MSRYLQTNQEIKDTYRVKAEYDLNTNDFPRDTSGAIDKSFDDIYIDCRDGIKIFHYNRSVLQAYIPSVQVGKNRIEKLKELGVDVYNINYTSQEAEFLFNVKYIHEVAKVLGAKTGGASISPFSPKNLPWRKYTIPQEDLQQYKDLNIPFSHSNKVVTQFAKKKKIDSSELRLKQLKSKEYFHSEGLWKEFIKFAKKYCKDNHIEQRS